MEWVRIDCHAYRSCARKNAVAIIGETLPILDNRMVNPNATRNVIIIDSVLTAVPKLKARRREFNELNRGLAATEAISEDYVIAIGRSFLLCSLSCLAQNVHVKPLVRVIRGMLPASMYDPLLSSPLKLATVPYRASLYQTEPSAPRPPSGLLILP